MLKTSPANQYQARAAKFLADTWGNDMATTYFAFKPDDCVAVLEALNVKNMPKILHTVGDMMVLARTEQPGKLAKLLEDQGISFNYASYAWADSMSATQAGQVRYGHDGTTQFLNLGYDPNIAAVYERFLPREHVIDDVQRLRLCFVCCGQDSWDNREAHGQMRKMRLLLT